MIRAGRRQDEPGLPPLHHPSPRAGGRLRHAARTGCPPIPEADRAYVLELGRIAAGGRSADLARDDRVIRSYLGGDLPA